MDVNRGSDYDRFLTMTDIADQHLAAIRGLAYPLDEVSYIDVLIKSEIQTPAERSCFVQPPGEASVSVRFPR